jgi:hypothetical protein
MPERFMAAWELATRIAGLQPGIALLSRQVNSPAGSKSELTKLASDSLDDAALLKK